MAKKKNARRKTRKLADRIAAKKKSEPEQINPFELHINRQKHNVVGRKSKHDKGLPGVAKAKAEKKRKETLLQEFKKKHKTNVFVDRRIGENDPTMTVEDKMAARFTVERQIAAEKKLRKKKDLFNLNEEEELTHYGQSLSRIEKFEDPRSDDDSEEEKAMNDFLRETSFGGFLTKKETPTEAVTEAGKSRKTRIEEIVADSILRKLERQGQKEEVFTLTEKLDSEWKDVRNIMLNKGETNATAPVPPDSYDVLVKALKFEARGKASDRIKSAEEVAEEKRKKLEALEAERLQRMQNTDNVPITRANHISADDLGGNLEIESGRKKKSEFRLRYDKDGKLITSDQEEDDDDDDDNNDLMLLNQVAESDDDDDDDGDNEDSEDDVSSEEDNYSDVLSDSESESEFDNSNSKKINKTKDDSPVVVRKGKIRIDGEIPLTFNAPTTCDEFREWVTCYSAIEQATVVERIIECNHPRLSADNKQKLEIFFDILINYIDEMASVAVSGSECDSVLNLMNAFVPWMWDLVQMSPDSATDCLLRVFNEKRDLYKKKSVDYLSGVESVYPNLDVLILVKLIPILFPTSDFRHKIVTPVMIFMGQILAECRVASRRDVSTGLFLCSVFYEYVSLSKRLVPEVLNFLTGLVSLALDENCFSSIDVFRPFKSSSKCLLKPDYPDNCKDIAVHPFKLKEVMSTEEITDEFRVNATWMSLDLLRRFSDLYSPLTAFHEIFNPIRVRWSKLSRSIYPREIKDTLESLDEVLGTRRLLAPLMRERRRPQSIKFFEPKIETDFTGRKQKKSSGKGTAEEQRLKHIVKRETKGAVRELRRDNQFLAKHQLDDQMRRDADRKRKVKELYQSLCGQEGDHRNLMKKKRKKK